MKARLLLRERIEISEAVFAERVVWEVPTPVRGSRHHYKYSLALVADNLCVLRYDNEAGKGDHRHVAEKEEAYRFVDLATLKADFWPMWRSGEIDNENRYDRRLIHSRSRPSP